MHGGQRPGISSSSCRLALESQGLPGFLESKGRHRQDSQGIHSDTQGGPGSLEGQSLPGFQGRHRQTSQGIHSNTQGSPGSLEGQGVPGFLEPLQSPKPETGFLETQRARSFVQTQGSQGSLERKRRNPGFFESQRLPGFLEGQWGPGFEVNPQHEPEPTQLLHLADSQGSPDAGSV